MNTKELEEKLGYSFKDLKLIDEALTHRSCKKEYNNERLEYLGDAVLDLIVGEYLFKKLTKAAEGELSKIRASLVNEKGLAVLAKRLDLGKFINISKAEESNKGREKPSIVSNAFEAVMGAIYLDSGLEQVEKIMINLLEEEYPVMDLKSLFKDYKTALQEITQARYSEVPVYTVIGEKGPDHNKEFEIQIEINGQIIAKAIGKSKKDAQQNVAKIALEKIK
ncbi:MAG: ribonuclease III [Campylobacterales bacterium]|nr:ribonuclease III [Campylobacterales bacterium]